MKRSQLIKIVRAIVLVSVFGSAGAYLYKSQASQPKSDYSTFYGNVDIRDVTLSFRVPGRVAEVKKTEGDSITKGELLATLAREPYELALRQAQAAHAVAEAQLKNVEAGARREDISQARAILAERKAGLTRAEDTYERIKKLEATGAATTQALNDARSMLEQNKAAVAASQASVSKLLNGARSEELVVAHARTTQAQAAVAIAELQLEDTELRASTDGVLVTRVIEPGTMVQPGSGALIVAIQDPVWIRAFAPEKALAQLAPGTSVEVTTDSRPQKTYRGQVGYVSPQAEFTPKNVETPELRTSLVYRFRVVVKDHDGELRQGMPVTLRLDSSAKKTP